MSHAQILNFKVLFAVVSLSNGCTSIAQPHFLGSESLAQTKIGITSSLVALGKPSASLYDRLGGVFAISSVVNHFSDALIENPIVGKTSANPALRKWNTESLDRLPGLKSMRTLWVCNITGGPFKYTPTVPGKTKLGLENAHQKFTISSSEFDEVVAELGRTLDFYKVPLLEKGEVLAAFTAHKHEVLGGLGR